MSQSRPPRYGILLVLLAGVCFSAMALSVRVARTSFSPVTLVFYRMLIQTLLLFPFWKEVGWGVGRESFPQKVKVHGFRAACGVLSMYSLFNALRLIPMGLSTVLAMTSVLWVALLAWAFLGERSSRLQLGYAGIILVGVGLCVWEPSGWGGGHPHWGGVAFALLNGFFMGCAFTYMRQLRRDRSAKEIVFYFGLAGLVTSAPGFFLSPEIPHSVSQWGLIVVVAFAGSAGQLFLTMGFRAASALTAALTNLFQSPLQIMIGALVLGELPPLLFYFGVSVLFSGIVGLTWLGYRRK